MTPDISGKLTVALLAAILLAAPAPSAAAWDEVCVKFAAGAGYAGHFNVIHGFALSYDGKMPGRAVAEELMGDTQLSPREFLEKMDYRVELLAQNERRPAMDRGPQDAYNPEKIRRGLDDMIEVLTWIPGLMHNPPRDAFTENGLPARGVIRSGRVHYPNTGCVSLRDLPRDGRFYVMLYADKKPGRRHVACGTRRPNPRWHFNRADGRSPKLEFNAAGSLFTPRCEYSREH